MFVNADVNVRSIKNKKVLYKILLISYNCSYILSQGAKLNL